MASPNAIASADDKMSVSRAGSAATVNGGE
jgi:hypothetical protein